VYSNDGNLHHKNVRNTAFNLVRCGTQLAYDNIVLQVFRESHKAYGMLLSPLAAPLLQLAKELAVPRKGETGKRRMRLLGDIRRDLENERLNFESSEYTASILGQLPNS
jgi:DnaJ-domain-containing protein 1